MTYFDKLTTFAAFGLILVFAVIWAAQSTMDGIARDCQKQTYFIVDKKKFECMEWK